MSSIDVIVIGGGHAGAEAAALAARSGARALLLTQNLETIGQMSCNPAIGGIAKGVVVREVDALGGIMGRATDRSRIQFRMLNRSKGPAVWSPRAQCDRGLYRRAVRMELERIPRIRFAQGTVARLVWQGARVAGVETTDGRRYQARAVVITAGTFLRGRIHVGLGGAIPAGRAGEPPSLHLSEDIAGQGLTVERFKTGTPPRIDGRSVALESLRRQDGDVGPYWFSVYERVEHPAQLPCYLTRSGPELGRIVRENLSSSALYGGAISGRGPRYCPSIEDKIVRFPQATGHQIFLEPEGLETTEMYVNGLSTSLPPAVQLEFLRSVPGLEQVEMTRPGYAIEYDYFPPTQLDHSLGVKGVEGLYFAGQINGTTGYEEAAGQGVVAGLNAAAFALDLEPVHFSRESSFIGVLVDDLVTKGVDEPYRLFTSRAELRMTIRQDNALRRLWPVANDRGLLTQGECRTAERQLSDGDRALEAAGAVNLGVDAANQLLGDRGGLAVDEPTRVRALVKRPGVPLGAALSAAGIEVDPVAAHWAEVEIRYEGYVAREAEAARRAQAMDGFELPETLEYGALETVSWEAREKFAKVRPRTLGQAGRIPGVTPSDLQNLVLAVLRARRG